MKPYMVVIVLALSLVSCQETPSVSVPSSNDVFLQDAKPLTATMRSAMEGVYSVVGANDMFGDVVVLKWSYVVKPNLLDTTFYMSVFTSKDVGFFVLEGGSLDSTFLFSGYWRKMVNTETGIARFTITSAKGGNVLHQPIPPVKKDSIVLYGEFGSGSSIADHNVTFTYQRPLYGKRFAVLGHRGGGRTSDMLPVSENTVDMALYAPRLGATGIEIDVRQTADDSTILYHDNELNPREVQRTGLVGKIENYTYKQLQAYVRLIHGERIPTLREVLEAALYRTSLTAVYLDNKASANLAKEREIQKEFMAKAQAAGRNFQMFIGIPSDDILNSFLALPDYASAPSLCELSMDQTRQAHSKVWSPRWTLGLQLAEIAQMHADSIAVITWTVDVPDYIHQYITQGNFDGLLTNYCPCVAYYHYVRQ